jgi:endonuclease/exonuclease/phosphatase family metal-dependent hydrolase
MAVLLVPYALSRIQSSGRRVSLHALPDTTQQTPAAPSRLRVACYNIAHGRGLAASNWNGETAEQRLQRLDQMGDLLNRIDADVVVLNEVDFDASWSHGVNQAEQLANQCGYPYWVEQRNCDARMLVWTWRFGNAVLSKYPITQTEVIDYPSYSTWETVVAGQKRGVVCSLQVGDHQLRVVAVHLSPRSESLRVDSVNMILRLARSSAVPVILAGDFNSTPPGFPQAAEDDHQRNAIAVLQEDGRFHSRPLRAPAPTDLTFSSDSPRSVIDWIFIPSSWQFADYVVEPSTLSDHRPVYADIELREGGEHEP